MTRRSFLRALTGAALIGGPGVLAACQNQSSVPPTVTTLSRRVSSLPVVRILVWQHFAEYFDVWLDNVERIASEKIGRETARYASSVYKYYVAYRLLGESPAMLRLITRAP